MHEQSRYRSSHPEVFLGKGVPKIYSKFTAEHLSWSAISIKLLCNFIEITLLHGCSLVNLLCIFRTPFSKNTYGGLLLSCFRNLLWHKVLPKPRHYAQLKSKQSYSLVKTTMDISISLSWNIFFTHIFLIPLPSIYFLSLFWDKENCFVRVGTCILPLNYPDIITRVKLKSGSHL